MGRRVEPIVSGERVMKLEIPVGYALVPIEPTPDMVRAALENRVIPDDIPAVPTGWTMNGLSFRSRYRAAIAAAPSVE